MGVRDGSPAAQAGLQTGDFLRAIDGKPTRDMSAIEATRLLRGAPGSKVSLLVLRGNAAEPHTVDVVRQPPASGHVTSRKLPGGEDKPVGERSLRVIRQRLRNVRLDHFYTHYPFPS